MQERVVRLVGQKQKLASVSLTKLQFWTESKWHCCKHLESSNGSTLLDLRVWQGELPVGEIIMDIGATKMVVAVQIIKLVQNGNEVDSLNIFKEQPWIFAQNGIICSY